MPNVDALNFLNNINPVGQINTGVEDVQNYVPQDLSPDEQQAFKNQYRPVTGQLSLNAYYPDANHNIGVGNYSGSEIGSTTLFAPGGGLVPLGMLDARDAAIQHAALKKQKDIEDFKRSYQSPTTKHIAVQKNLSETYQNGLSQWNQNALRKAGGDQAMANKILEMDPNFQGWNKSMQDTANFHNAIVEHAAQLHADEKDPNFVLDPETKKATADLLSGVAYHGESPFNPKGRQIGEKYLAASALYDIDKTVNNAIDKAIPTIDQLPPEYKTRGKNEIATLLEKEYFTDDAKKELAHNIYMEKYQGTGVTEDQVLKNVNAKLGEKIKRHTQHYDKWYKPDKEDKADVYTENDISKEPSSTNVYTKNVGGSTEQGEAVGDYGVQHKQPIKTIIPTGRNIFINDENKGLIKTSEVSPNADVKLFKTELVKVYNGPAKDHVGTPLSEQQIKDGRPWKWQTMTKGVITDKNEDGEKTEKQFFVPTKEVENVLVKEKDKNGNVRKGVPVDKIYNEESTRNSQLENSNKKTPAKVEDLRKKYNY